MQTQLTCARVQSVDLRASHADEDGGGGHAGHEAHDDHVPGPDEAADEGAHDAARHEAAVVARVDDHGRGGRQLQRPAQPVRVGLRVWEERERLGE